MEGAIKWRAVMPLVRGLAVRPQLHALAYSLGNFLRKLATPEAIKDWSLTAPMEKLIKIGAKSGEPWNGKAEVICFS
jgi:hypothetical protein